MTDNVRTTGGIWAAGPSVARAVVHRPALLWACVAVWFAATAWIRPPAMPDEGRYLSVAWEMMARGDWWTPTLNGLPFFHKPPLFYWFAQAAMHVLGVNAFAGRIPSIAAAATLVCAMYWFTGTWTKASLARRVLVVLGTSPYLYIGAQYANMDMLVAACICVSVLCAAHAALRLQRGDDAGPALPASYVAAALGVLAKGLIGCVLPAIIVVCWLSFAGRARAALRLFSPLGIALFLALTLPWPVAMQARYAGFLDYFIIEQHFHRFAGSGFNNAQPLWFYLPVIIVLMLPWSLALPAVWRRFRHGAKDPEAVVRLLMLCWAAVVIVFFSIPQSKLIGYALPAVAPLAWLLADGIGSLKQSVFLRRYEWTLAGGTSVVLLGAVISYGVHAPHSSELLAAVLATERKPNEAVQLVDTYPYDLVFEARLQPPLAVLEHWSDPALRRRDSWQRELLDGARFDPARASSSLLERVPPTLAPGTWMVAPTSAALPSGLHGKVIIGNGQLTLWRVERD